MSLQQFWNLSQLLGVFTCRKLANLCQNFVTEMCKNNVPKLPGVDYVAKNWFISEAYCCWKSKIMMTSVRKMLKMLVRSAQNRLISSEICPENNHKIRRYLPIAFRPSLPLKIPAKTADFSAILPPKNPAKFDFFPQSIRSPVNVKASVRNHQTSPTQTSLKCCDLMMK